MPEPCIGMSEHRKNEIPYRAVMIRLNITVYVFGIGEFRQKIQGKNLSCPENRKDQNIADKIQKEYGSFRNTKSSVKIGKIRS